MSETPERIWANGYVHFAYPADPTYVEYTRADIAAADTRAAVREALAELRKAAGALVDFHNLPRAAQRPDIWQMRMNALGRALDRIDEPETGGTNDR